MTWSLDQQWNGWKKRYDPRRYGSQLRPLWTEKEAWRLVTRSGPRAYQRKCVPNEGYPFPACEMSVPLCGANPTCGLIGHRPALAFRLSGNAVAVRAEPLGLWHKWPIYELFLNKSDFGKSAEEHPILLPCPFSFSYTYFDLHYSGCVSPHYTKSRSTSHGASRSSSLHARALGRGGPLCRLRESDSNVL